MTAPEMKKTLEEMERKIGEIFEFEGKKYECISGKGCGHCIFFSSYKCMVSEKVTGECTSALRKDRESIIFIEVKE